MAEQSESTLALEASPMLEDVLQVLPRLVQRTADQLGLARALASHLSCLGSAIVSRPAEVSSPGRIAAEPLDVLDLLNEPEETRASVSTVAPTDVPSQSRLAVHEYDSLAASQVIPRLATLGGDDLRAILAYEQAHRNRQTIVHRLSQLLAI